MWFQSDYVRSASVNTVLFICCIRMQGQFHWKILPIEKIDAPASCSCITNELQRGMQFSLCTSAAKNCSSHNKGLRMQDSSLHPALIQCSSFDKFAAIKLIPSDGLTQHIEKVHCCNGNREIYSSNFCGGQPIPKITSIASKKISSNRISGQFVCALRSI